MFKKLRFQKIANNQCVADGGARDPLKNQEEKSLQIKIRRGNQGKRKDAKSTG